MSIVQFAIHKRVLVNMLMIGIFTAGFLSLFHLRREIFPSISTDVITIITLDVTLDAPEDVEKLITIPIEDKVRDIEEIDTIISVSEPNMSKIFLELHDNVDSIESVLNDVRQAADEAQQDLPGTAEKPVASEVDFPFPVIIAGLTFSPQADTLEIKELADELQDEFEAIQGVASVTISGLNDREIWVEVDPFRAQSYGVSLAQIGAAIKAKNMDIPGGTLEGPAGKMTLRILEQVNENTWQELKDIVIKNTNGRTVRLGDVAHIKNTFEEASTLGRVDAMPAVTFTVNKQENGDTIAIADKVRKMIDDAQDRLPKGVKLTFYYDTSKYVRIRLQTMVRNGIISMILVAITLLLFMNWRISLLVVVGLLVSFFGTFAYLLAIKNSFNMLSLFSLIMVLGLLVDDAIVVCENVYRHMENGESPYTAARIGTEEVLWPVIGTVSTTIVAFLPLLLTTGIMGKFVSIIPQVVTIALLLSLVEAMLILPSHLADFIRPADLQKHSSENHTSLLRKILRFPDRLIKFIQRIVEKCTKRIIELYSFVLKNALRCRYLVLLLVIAAFFSALMMIKTGILRFILFDADYADRFIISLEAPPYYSLEDTSKLVYKLERDLIAQMPSQEIAAVVTSIGSRQQDEFVSKIGENQANIFFDIQEDHPECRSPMPILKDLRRIVGKYSAFQLAEVEKEGGGPPVGRAVTVRIGGDDFSVLRRIAQEYKDYLRNTPGVTDISDDFEQGKKEIHIEIDEGKAALVNCDVASIGQEILSAFQGAEVSIFRWGNDEVTVRVKYADEYTENISDIMSFRIVSATGKKVPLGSIATITHAPGLASINRRDRKRVITVYADVDDVQITSKEANTQLKEKFADVPQRYPGYTIEYGGEEKDTQESLRSMAIAGVLAFVLIYAILATILNSFIQPLIIMGIVPLGFVGVVYGFILYQTPLGFMAMLGTIGLVGIIVNDSIIMVSFVNNHRLDWQQKHGLSEDVKRSPNRHITAMVRWSSLMRSGATRFRPILLTTVTTIVGMSTIAFVRSGQEQFIAPMALSLVCGLAFGWAVTLLVTPCIYAVLDDIIHFFSGSGELPDDITVKTNTHSGWPGAV